MSVKTRITFASFVLLFLFIPGMNYYQTLTLNPQSPKVKGVNIEIPISDYPVFNNAQTPYLTAQSAIAIDLSSAAILYQKNPDYQMLPASTTKIMTALVALDHFKFSDVLTIKQASDSIGHSMNLIKGEKISVENLLYGILVESGNDAAFALASNYPGGYSAFVKAMNHKAQQLNLSNTHFRNVSGVEQWGHLTTVKDLSVLAKHALQNPTFAKMVNTKTITVKSEDGSTIHVLENINQLLGKVQGIKGVKTGWTENAGECLVSFVERNDRQIITVILKSQDRFGETEKLIDWVYSSYYWETAPSIHP